MDRADQLRMLMKQQMLANGTKGVALDGKAKAALLKQQKNESHSSLLAKSVPIATKKSSSKAHVLPSDFFDAESEPIFAISTKTVANHANKRAPVPTATINQAPSLPLGFYENPAEDLAARGINQQVFQKEKEKHEEKELSSFLNEIDSMADRVEAEEERLFENEAEAAENEETALQMSYLTKLAVILNSSEDIVSKYQPPSEQPAAPTSSADRSGLLTAMLEASELETTIAATEVLASSSALSEVEQILRQKRKASLPMQSLKKARVKDGAEEIDGDEQEEQYDPLAFL